MTKAALARLALELRAEVGADPRGPFDPYALAAEYGLAVVSMSELDCADAVRHFTATRPAAFSGALVPVGTGARILENNSHDRLRRRSTVAHEMAHWALEHVFRGILLATANRCGIGSRQDERDAAELAGELLVPVSAARWLAYQDATDPDVADRFDVSIEMARWRMNGTGARVVAARTAARRRGSASR